MAGFDVSIYGRFWVSTEASSTSKILASGVISTISRPIFWRAL